MNFWAKVSIKKRELRRSFGRLTHRSGTDEYVIKIPGFSGELRKTMTPKEAEKFVRSSNESAFIAAAEASKGGLKGYERFTRYGKSDNGVASVMGRALARGFKDRSKGDKTDGDKPKG